MDLKEHLSEIAKNLGELEAHARGLVNQNVADIVAGAKARVQQLLEHADLTLVQQRADGEDVSEHPKPEKPEATQLDQTATVDGTGPRRPAAEAAPPPAPAASVPEPGGVPSPFPPVPPT